MKSSYMIPCLVLLLMNTNLGFSRIKSRNNKPPIGRKSGSNIPKTNTGLPLGLLLYKGNRLSLHFNMTDESQVYTANYTMFPDELHYPRPRTFNVYEEFLASCMNTTLELEANKDKISKLGSDVYTRVTYRIIEFLCAENYNREGDNAGLPPRGLWMVTMVTAMLLVMNTLD